MTPLVAALDLPWRTLCVMRTSVVGSKGGRLMTSRSAVSIVLEASKEEDEFICAVLVRGKRQTGHSLITASRSHNQSHSIHPTLLYIQRRHTQRSSSLTPAMS